LNREASRLGDVGSRRTPSEPCARNRLRGTPAKLHTLHGQAGLPSKARAALQQLLQNKDFVVIGHPRKIKPAMHIQHG